MTPETYALTLALGMILAPLALLAVITVGTVVIGIAVGLVIEILEGIFNAVLFVIAAVLKGFGALIRR